MSPNGTLLAYSRPTDIKELRDQAAIVSLTWKDNDPTFKAAREQAKTGSATIADLEEPPAKLETLTVESDQRNVLVRSIQPQILLVLIGGVPPNRKIDFKITAEMLDEPPSSQGHNSPVREEADDEDDLGEHASSAASSEKSLPSHASSDRSSSSHANAKSFKPRTDSDVAVLRMHRQKLESLAAYLKDEFEKQGFVMPDIEEFGDSVA